MHISDFYFLVVLSLPLIGVAEHYQALRKSIEGFLDKSNGHGRAYDLIWLQNSNKIGLGYNPRVGSPVCFTGDCQATGFRRPVFNLTYTSNSPGSCTSQLIPDHVNLDCLPSSVSSATAQEISSLQELNVATSSGFQISVGFQGAGLLSALSFSYGYSQQTTYMVDTILKKSQSVFFTTAKVTFAKLLLFEPTAKLSEEFQYVIENMPCCNENDSNVIDYVYNSIFDYFGYTYVTELMLGGRAQTLVTMKTSDVSKLESEGVSTKHEAKVGFFVKFETSVTNSYDRTKQEKFSSKVQEEQWVKLGGDPSTDGTINEWAKTVPDNPAITSFHVKYIFELLQPFRFPRDEKIVDKARIVRNILTKYLTAPPFCYNNCSGHGSCVPTGMFRVGACTCDRGYWGMDCSSTAPLLPSGTLCGWAFTGSPVSTILCDGFNPLNACPPGYAQFLYASNTKVMCYKLQTNFDFEKSGMLCGAKNAFGFISSVSSIPCGYQSINNACPSDYTRSSAITLTVYGRVPLYTCYKANATLSESDTAGTWCGYFNSVTNVSIPCDGESRTGRCPNGYRSQFLLSNIESTCINV